MTVVLGLHMMGMPSNNKIVDSNDDYKFKYIKLANDRIV